ncbi:soluble calcium-activated nucleotidase 1 [Diaphorina citri]|uniref:Soluble calcium-activated nucleotidase 1 n=1 Tax=Diaphorina citri TaxID=121845 RepID=A0A3Q0ITQ8_DIACI|nr:soluble calcium-activated nucleotidase 1 [Diaphorina citri]
MLQRKRRRHLRTTDLNVKKNNFIFISDISQLNLLSLSSGFKSEWATVKDETLYIGGMGKEWTSTTGEFLSYDPMWVKAVSNTGQVMHLNWTSNYMTLRRSLNIEFPGYMIHESGVWSEYHQRWFFLPRRSSHFKYDEVTDERMATNVLLSTDSNFTNVMVTYIGEVIPTHGYSSFFFYINHMSIIYQT